VEEQFYLVWGACLLFFQKRLLACAAVFATVSIAYTCYAIENGLYHDLHTLTYLFDFAVGIASAVYLHNNGSILAFLKRTLFKNQYLFVAILPVLFISLFLITDFTPASWFAWTDLAGRYLFVSYIGLFIMEQMINENSFLKLRSNKFLVYTGKISYGLYCFHGIVLTFGIAALEKMNVSLPIVIRAVVLLTVNYGVSAISYQFIEKPFLHLKNKLRRI
jgi:peptidoglycan/LPS O-acetylase OafA/YrhL